MALEEDLIVINKPCEWDLGGSNGDRGLQAGDLCGVPWLWAQTAAGGRQNLSEEVYWGKGREWVKGSERREEKRKGERERE